VVGKQIFTCSFLASI